MLRAVLGLQRAAGAIRLGDAPLHRLAPRDRALRASYVPQDRSLAWAISVEALVALGRLPHRSGPGADRAAVDAALAVMDLAAFRARPATELSGGERAAP